MKTIVVSGSVGSGKTILSKKLSKALNYEYVDVSKLIKKNKLSSGYDKENECEIIDVKKLNKFLISLIGKKNLIIDSHLSHYLPKKYVDLCIVTTCDINILKDRLKKRKYNAKKIRDNVEAEIFDTIVIEAKEKKHHLFVLSTTHGYKIKDIVNFINES
ncbi:AAA family ATPase [Candidatus Woesearchaeota archaeon]|jgi:adenylate kinase|nr:AAA family ATPase [Candidatus Woesearchaeota archaeon]MBT7237270.1 AAA family ATPase [Candidatus Woesearchaeota archaeon]